jgi:hypothetical protein
MPQCLFTLNALHANIYVKFCYFKGYSNFTLPNFQFTIIIKLCIYRLWFWLWYCCPSQTNSTLFNVESRIIEIFLEFAYWSIYLYCDSKFPMFPNIFYYEWALLLYCTQSNWSVCAFFPRLALVLWLFISCHDIFILYHVLCPV